MLPTSSLDAESHRLSFIAMCQQSVMTDGQKDGNTNCREVIPMCQALFHKPSGTNHPVIRSTEKFCIRCTFYLRKHMTILFSFPYKKRTPDHIYFRLSSSELDLSHLPINGHKWSNLCPTKVNLQPPWPLHKRICKVQGVHLREFLNPIMLCYVCKSKLITLQSSFLYHHTILKPVQASPRSVPFVQPVQRTPSTWPVSWTWQLWKA